MVAEKVEATHTDLTEVTRVVLVQVGTVVVLTTGHTTTTGVLLNEDSKSVHRFYSDSPSFFMHHCIWYSIFEVRIVEMIAGYFVQVCRTLRCLPIRPLPAETCPRCC